MVRRLLSFLVIASALALAPSAFAQTCSISSTFTSTGTSNTCFQRSGNSARMALTGTWVGTVQAQMSTDNGTSWRVLRTYTSNATLETPAQGGPALFRWAATAYTSGTVTYTIYDITIYEGKPRYSTVPIGSVAYSSFGYSVAGISTSGIMADVFVQAPMNATGLAFLVGGTGGTDTVTLSLYDSRCRLVASTAATTVSSTTNAFQQIAFSTAPATLQPGRYRVLVQVSGTTATIRRIKPSTFIDVFTADVTGLTYGTVPATCQPPASQETSGDPNALTGPVAYIY